MQSLAEKLILLTKQDIGRNKKGGRLGKSNSHKIMSTLSGPVSMLHPGADQIMGTVGNIAGGIDRHLNKR
ncbi:MAG: hypothetical protein EZS28_036536 [Streblomastix strix]|uniref:Uncharacterized protein n=1 Tax=Streblomastix strix TaxID=222440 RepID=A0A5J4UBS8_9EUKA|nr:MAG: hypothetical protein EZS28_036536 [Streblomastix strix]